MPDLLILMPWSKGPKPWLTTHPINKTCCFPKPGLHRLFTHPGFHMPPPSQPTCQLPNHFWELPCPHTTSRSIMSPWEPPSFSSPREKKNVPQNLHPLNREVSIPWETPSSPFHDGATICPRQSLPVQETQVVPSTCMFSQCSLGKHHLP